uniref:Uncharacterized protein n=1 Tax=Mus musculus TaxID=10090 RepID=Q3TZQ7_MOUSE|nr:unnamed protein product [Mus musculus]
MSLVAFGFPSLCFNSPFWFLLSLLPLIPFWISDFILAVKKCGKPVAEFFSLFNMPICSLAYPLCKA